MRRPAPRSGACAAVAVARSRSRCRCNQRDKRDLRSRSQTATKISRRRCPYFSLLWTLSGIGVAPRGGRAPAVVRRRACGYVARLRLLPYGGGAFADAPCRYARLPAPTSPPSPRLLATRTTRGVSARARIRLPLLRLRGLPSLQPPATHPVSRADFAAAPRLALRAGDAATSLAYGTPALSLRWRRGRFCGGGGGGGGLLPVANNHRGFSNGGVPRAPAPHPTARCGPPAPGS